MIASDLLITDYSAIAFDYSILCRPILVYAYDYEEYLLERGTYFDIDDKYPNKS
ncbi:MAG: CDP-glycerol glycerophosphotransferase family protein [bacterium]|nr:CDP-glycerol glycerophosphotransferase family protein [bacterium]